jgi:asparagine synthase (glutamine-hydrolysing)
MCGIAGFLTLAGNNVSERDLKSMADAIRYRGPDDDGIWTDESAGIGLAHRRLAIVDLSPAGQQPMVSHSGRYIIIFNGEIYNHVTMRERLVRLGVGGWRGHSDTETLLEAIEQYGLTEALHTTTGMFAFALWDRKTQQLSLGRDRLGEKPLYYGWQRKNGIEAFLFGSDLNALRAHPAFVGAIDQAALSAYLSYAYVPAPRSIYANIQKLPPGAIAQVSRDKPDAQLSIYWSAEAAARKGIANPFSGSADQSVDSLEALLSKAVSQQMLADVPLGAFLSGGVDSSAIVALMQAQSGRPVKTFSIGFGDPEHNEAAHARAVAVHLGTDHTELNVTAEMALDVIPDLPSMYSEPFADSSQIPTHLVSKLARESVTVALSGDAGDELFGGYNRYIMAQQLHQRMQTMPRPVKRAVASVLGAIAPSKWNRIAKFLPQGIALSNLANKIPKIQRALRAETADAIYNSFASNMNSALVRTDTTFGSRLPGQLRSVGGFVDNMMVTDLLCYLPDDILCKVDRAAMAVSLETRVPMLDHTIVEFAWSLPLSVKIRGGIGKWPLRQLLYRYVPQAMIDRPKMGFSVPLDGWLRGPLRSWANDILVSEGVRNNDLIDSVATAKLWQSHVSGERDHGSELWPILMYHAWHMAHHR